MRHRGEEGGRIQEEKQITETRRAQCRQELHEVQRMARRRGHHAIHTLREPPQGLEPAIRCLLRENEGSAGSRWVSLLWATDTKGLLSKEGEDGTLPPHEAQALTAELIKSQERALIAAARWPDTNFILWMPKEQDQAVRLLSHLVLLAWCIP